MDANASVRVAGPSGATVHLLGVSHNSALYGKLAHDLIRTVQPCSIVLEVDEVCQLPNILLEPSSTSF
jgi:hypothetical protein